MPSEILEYSGQLPWRCLPATRWRRQVHPSFLPPWRTCRAAVPATRQLELARFSFHSKRQNRRQHVAALAAGWGESRRPGWGESPPPLSPLCCAARQSPAERRPCHELMQLCAPCTASTCDGQGRETETTTQHRTEREESSLAEQAPTGSLKRWPPPLQVTVAVLWLHCQRPFCCQPVCQSVQRA